MILLNEISATYMCITLNVRKNCCWRSCHILIWNLQLTVSDCTHKRKRTFWPQFTPVAALDAHCTLTIVASVLLLISCCYLRHCCCQWQAENHLWRTTTIRNVAIATSCHTSGCAGCACDCGTEKENLFGIAHQHCCNSHFLSHIRKWWLRLWL